MNTCHTNKESHSESKIFSRLKSYPMKEKVSITHTNKTYKIRRYMNDEKESHNEGNGHQSDIFNLMLASIIKIIDALFNIKDESIIKLL